MSLADRETSLGRIILFALVANIILRALVLYTASPFISAPEDECIYGTVALEMLSHPDLAAYDYVWPYKGGGVLTIHALRPLVALFGAHAVTIKSLSLIVSCFILVLTTWLVDRYEGRRAAALMAAMLVLAPPHYVFRTLMTIGDHFLARAFDLVVIAAALPLIAGLTRSPRSYLLLGVAIGLAGWVSYDTGPLALACLLLVAVRTRRPVGFIVITAGIIIGFLPGIAYNASNDNEGFLILGGNSPPPGGPSLGPTGKLMRLVARDLRQSFDFQHLPRRGLIPVPSVGWTVLSWLYTLGLATGYGLLAVRVLRKEEGALGRLLVIAPIFHVLAYTLGPFVIDDKGLRAARYLLPLYVPLMAATALSVSRLWERSTRVLAAIVALSLLVPGGLASISLVSPGRWGANLDLVYKPVCREETGWFLGWRYRDDPGRLAQHCSALLQGHVSERYCPWGAGWGEVWERGPVALSALPCDKTKNGPDRVACIAGALEALRWRWQEDLAPSGAFGTCTARVADERTCSAAVGAGIGWRKGIAEELACTDLPILVQASCRRGIGTMTGADAEICSTHTIVALHDDDVTALLVVGDVVYTGSADGTVRALALSNLSQIASATNPGGTVFALTANDTSLFVGSYDGSISVWSLTDLAAFRTWPAHREIVFGLTWNGTALVSSSHDGTVKLWDTGSRKRLNALVPGQGILTGVAIARGMAVIGGFNARVLAWSGTSFKPDRILAAHTGSVLSTWSDGRDVHTGSMDGTIKVWRAGDGTIRFVRNILGHTSAVTALDGDHEVLVSAGIDGTVLVWDRATGSLLLNRTAGTSVYSVALTPCRVLAGLGEGRLISWPRPAPERSR